MSTNRMVERSRGPLLAVAALLAPIACGDGEIEFARPLNGGSAGAAAAPHGGSVSGQGSAGKSQQVGAVAGAGGATTGGKGGQGSLAGAGGTTVSPPGGFECEGTVPNQSIITKFDGFMGDDWTGPGNLEGGAYVYPDSLKPAEGEHLRFEGEVKDHTGIGAWLNACVDASKFDGVRFTLYGDAGSSGSVAFSLITNRTRTRDEQAEVGGCIPEDASDAWESCRPPVTLVAVTAAATTHSIPWSAFTGGRPSTGTNGSDILSLQWSFEWVDASSSTPYHAQLTIDDLEFFTD
jgi:hypothetical protein